MKNKWVVAVVLAGICSFAQAEVIYSGVITGATTEGGYPDAHIAFDMKSSNYAIGWYPALAGSAVTFRVSDLINDISGTLRGVVSTADYNLMGARLSADTVIGPDSAWSGWAYIMQYSGDENPEWWDGGADIQGYAGMKLYMDDAYHYGWVDISYSSGTGLWSVNGWAYETQVDTAIGAGAVESIPEPATALILGFGGGLIALYRRFFGRA